VLPTLLYAPLHNRGPAQERIMLNVEINFAGFRFSREVPDLRQKLFRSPGSGQRAIQWRMPHLRRPNAA
jgi:hypothetical protein